MFSVAVCNQDCLKPTDSIFLDLGGRVEHGTEKKKH